MGFAKREMERHYELLGEATEIAVEAGVLEICEAHGTVMCTFAGDDAAAYKLGNAKFTAGTLRNEFQSRPELTDLIKKAIEESSDGCPQCQKVLAD